MQKKSILHNVIGAQKFFVIPIAVLIAAVYAASAAPKKDIPPVVKVAEKKTPSLFAPSAPAATPPVTPQGNDKAAQQTPITVRPPRGRLPEENWTMTLEVDRDATEDWEEAYYRYFKQHKVYPSIIRERVRSLTEGQSPDLKQVIGLLRASMRAGQIQPWMYEALALAMRIEKMPADEIERVLLSSADFATSARQVIFLAEYMDRLGYRQRALELLREVTLRDPSAELAYAKALDIAIYLDDADALQWSTLGVLSQEWPRENATIFEKAVRHSKSLVEQMRENGLDQQADQYASKLKQALARDVVVKVSWSGDADVDLMVEEPTGSVCSYRQNKTPGGGLLVGDPNAGLSDTAGGSHSEVYSCPEAYSGDYRVLLRQVWGRIPAGRVTVDVWSHLGSENQQHIQRVIPLDEDGALVSFHLDSGRRQERLADQQLVNDVVQQVAVNRTILAQQLESISNPEALLAQRNYVNSQPASQIGNRSNPLNRPSPNAFNPNLVGYQPQITVLPIGMTMQANAVISADRRYVRITTLPFFSTIKGVVQYNLQTGVTDQGQSDEAFQNLDINIDQDGGQNGNADGGGGGGGGGAGFVLTVSVPAPLPASFGPGPLGVVSRTGSTAEALAVNLSGFDSTIITIQPADVVIPAGQASQFFNI
ncbi:MAG: hypothetical protein P8M53_12890, partial [Pirellulales bacterium]|nr:hypothetical protein [Pirellulales bacterium]